MWVILNRNQMDKFKIGDKNKFEIQIHSEFTNTK